MRNLYVPKFILLFLLACTGFGSVASADLIIQTAKNALPNLERFSTGGVDLGVFKSAPIGEEVVALLAGTGGDVYAVANTLGNGEPIRFNSSGTATADGINTALTLPAGAALIGDIFFSGSTKFGPSQTGVMAFDANTLAFLGNVLPSLTTVGPSILDLASEGSRLYVVDSQKVTRFTVGGTTLIQDLSFQMSVTGHLRFKPGDHSLYLAANGRIDRYDVTGQLQGTFIPAGIAGMTGIGDFAFGDDGFLYVTASTSGGAELLKFDATTGEYIQQLSQIGNAGSIVVQTPNRPGYGLFAYCRWSGDEPGVIP